MYIHTLETSCILDNNRFYNIQRILTEQDKSKWEAEKEGMTYFGLSDKGIIIKMYKIKKKGYFSYYILYRISARRVIDNNNYVGLFDVKDYDILKEKVNELLESKCDILPKLKDCSLHRIDFCINVYLDSQEQVKAYIKTANRANVPATLDRKTYYDKKSKRTKPTKYEMCVTGKNNVEVSIYNKYKEMTTQEKYKYHDSEIEKAENIVRIEIRCMGGKIKSLKDKFKIQTISDFMSYGNIIGNDLYHYYLTKMFGKGKMFTLKEAINRIEMSGFKPKNIELMTEFITEANNSRSVAETAKLYRKISGKKETKRILFMFDCIDTNYVTATNEAAKLFEYGYIPTPMELIEDFM